MEICIDAGASSSKWTSFDLINGFISGVAPALTGHIFAENDFLKVRNTLTGIKNSANNADNLFSVTLGITGLDKKSKISMQIEGIAKQVFGINKITIISDMELASQAVFPEADGILVYAGTGSIAFHASKSGELIRAGGRGYLIGDEGGGFSIGRGAIALTAKYWDLGKNPFDYNLCSNILDFTKSKNWEELREYVYSGGRSSVAAIAKVVIDCANLGDKYAIDLLKQSGKELAELCKILNGRTGLNKYVAMGGVFRSNTHTLESLIEGIGTKVDYIEADISNLWLEINSKFR